MISSNPFVWYAGQRTAEAWQWLRTAAYGTPCYVGIGCEQKTNKEIEKKKQTVLKWWESPKKWCSYPLWRFFPFATDELMWAGRSHYIDRTYAEAAYRVRQAVTAGTARTFATSCALRRYRSSEKRKKVGHCSKLHRLLPWQAKCRTANGICEDPWRAPAGRCC